LFPPWDWAPLGPLCPWTWWHDPEQPRPYCRAALESIAYQSLELLRCMTADSRTDIEELRVDGGATANDTLMQFQADILGVPVVRPSVLETTALGAACLAGLAVQCWKGFDPMKPRTAAAKRFLPGMDKDKVEQLTRGWKRSWNGQQMAN